MGVSAIDHRIRTGIYNGNLASRSTSGKNVSSSIFSTFSSTVLWTTLRQTDSDNDDFVQIKDAFITAFFVLFLYISIFSSFCVPCGFFL